MSGVLCTNNAHDRLLVSVTLEKRERACALFVQRTPDLVMIFQSLVTILPPFFDFNHN